MYFCIVTSQTFLTLTINSNKNKKDQSKLMLLDLLLNKLS